MATFPDRSRFLTTESGVPSRLVVVGSVAPDTFWNLPAPNGSQETFSAARLLGTPAPGQADCPQPLPVEGQSPTALNW